VKKDMSGGAKVELLFFLTKSKWERELFWRKEEKGGLPEKKKGQGRPELERA